MMAILETMAEKKMGRNKRAKKVETTNFNSPGYELHRDTCVVCGAMIHESVPKGTYRLKRIECCDCLCRWWEYERFTRRQQAEKRKQAYTNREERDAPDAY